MKLHSPRNIRIAAATLAGASAMAMLAGCSNSNDTGSSNGEPSGTLQVLVSSAPGSDAAFKATNAAFMKKYPKVKVVFSTISNTTWKAAESSRITAGNVDVLVAGPHQVPSYAAGSEDTDAKLADSGSLLDLSKQSFMKRITPTVAEYTEYKGKHYSLPLGMSYETGVFYNKSIFSKYNLSVPTTWDEFVKDCDTLKAAGVTPLGIGGQDQWPAGLLMLGVAQSQYPTTQAKQDLAKKLWDQKVKLTDSDLVGVLDKIEKLLSYGQQGFAGTAYTSIPAEFAAGKFAMTADGTWDEPTIASAIAGKFEIGYFPLPASNNADDNKYLSGKADLQLAVAAKAPNKTAALAYLDFISQKDNYTDWLKTAGFSPAEQGIPASSFLTSIAQYTSEFRPAWDQIWVQNVKAGKDAQFPFNYLALDPMGSSSPAQAAQAAQTAWAAAF